MMLRLALLSLFVVAQTAGQANPQYFRYQRAVHVVAPAARAQTCVPISADVFPHAASGLTDLRLYSAAREVPYVIHTGAASVPASAPSPTLLNVGERNGHVVFDVHLSHPSYSALSITTKAQDFIASVEVSGSQSAGATPATRLGTFAIFDLTRQKLNRSTVLHLPPSTFPYLHMEITGPLNPDDVQGVEVVETPVRPLVYRTIATAGQVIQEHGHSVMHVAVPSQVPVERIAFVLPPATGNFSREVFVEAVSPSKKPAARFSGNIFRVHTIRDGITVDQEQYTLDMIGDVPRADTGQTQWTITVDNGDDSPLAFANVQLAMQERQLCFDADSGAIYTLYYGDSTIAAPRYDYARLFRPSDHPSHATLDIEQRNTAFQVRPDTRPFTERHPGLLWLALVVVVLCLGVIAMRSSARMPPS